MDAYRNNDNPAFGPRLRVSQAIPDDPSPPPVNDTPPTPQHSVSSSQTPTPKESVSATSKELDEAIKKAESGDKIAQFALGDKYYYAQGAPQDYSSAMDWYLKAADQGHATTQSNIGDLYHGGHDVVQDYSATMD